MKNIAALIPAAGYSSRMGLFKPLLPLSPSTLVIERPIKVFYEAGIDDVRVVVGHKADLLQPLLKRLGTRALFNENYARGMYSSVQAGVRSLSEETAAFFLLPADCPFISVETIRQLKAAAGRKTCDIVYPLHNGVKGHPPLISTRLRPHILQEEIAGGLRELLSKLDLNEARVAVDDPGILLDLDSEDDYRRLLPPSLAGYPSRDECEKILAERNAPADLLAHGRKVAAVAETISEHLNSRGFRIHLGLIVAGGLLHDIAKGEKEHPRKGRQILAARGYPGVAEIIAAHMDLPEGRADEIDERSLLYLADKMVEGRRVISLEERRDKKLALFQNNPEARQTVIKRIRAAMKLQKKVEKIIGFRLEELFGEAVEENGWLD
jgi:molybdenum cofactor cytidylyltransferase